MSQHTQRANLKRNGFNPKSFQGKKAQQETKDFLIEWTENDYSKQLVLTAWNKTIEEMEDSVATGERTFHFEVTSRESNGKWYTTAKVWKVS